MIFNVDIIQYPTNFEIAGIYSISCKKLKLSFVIPLVGLVAFLRELFYILCLFG